MVVHRCVSQDIFNKFNPALVGQVTDRYEQKRWDFLFGNSSNHITAFLERHRGEKEVVLIVKTTRDYEQKLVMITPEEFLSHFII